MFHAADIVVKAVMIGCYILASVLTWTVWIAKSIELGGARRSLRNASQPCLNHEPGRCRAENWREETYVRSLIEQADLELRCPPIY